MCTAVSFQSKDHYFGRNLDLEYSYDEQVVITPRNYPFLFRSMPELKNHYAMIGMATVSNNYPLYYEATNECGLSIAGLNFPGNAQYFPKDIVKDNLAPFELIPWVLGRCANTAEARILFQNMNIANIPFSDEYPLSPLHWIVSDKEQSIVIEQTKNGLNIYDNPIGILTNNPTFPYHLENLKNYILLSPYDPVNNISKMWDLSPYSRGQGAIGLPGDWSSASRFVRAAFVKGNSCCNYDELSSVSHFFHILNAVSMPRGCVMVNNKPEITIYSSCCNTECGIYYYTTYDNSEINAVDLFAEDLNGNDLYQYPLVIANKIKKIN